MTRTLSEISEMTGRPVPTLRKHIERGRLVATRDGAISLVEDDDLDRYLAAEELQVTAEKIREPGVDVAREIGNMITRLPTKVATAILEGMPTSKKQGSGDEFVKATKKLPKNQPVSEVSEDPHFGRPVGYQHKESPRWKRKNQSTWALDGATFSWNGFGWEGGGDRSGIVLGDDVSPAHPASDKRPLAPPVVDRK